MKPYPSFNQNIASARRLYQARGKAVGNDFSEDQTRPSGWRSTPRKI